MTGRASLYETITNEILAELNRGVAPWVQPWTAGGGGALLLPYNAASHHRYRGVNILLLWLIITHIYSSSCWPARKPARKPATSKVKACNPRHRVLTPGMPSFLRFRWPPKRPIHWMA